MLSDPLTLYKLMILYLLKQSKFPLSNSQLSEFFLEKEYTTCCKCLVHVSLFFLIVNIRALAARELQGPDGRCLQIGRASCRERVYVLV